MNLYSKKLEKLKKVAIQKAFKSSQTNRKYKFQLLLLNKVVKIRQENKSTKFRN